MCCICFFGDVLIAIQTRCTDITASHLITSLPEIVSGTGNAEFQTWLKDFHCILNRENISYFWCELIDSGVNGGDGAWPSVAPSLVGWDVFQTLNLPTGCYFPKSVWAWGGGAKYRGLWHPSKCKVIILSYETCVNHFLFCSLRFKGMELSRENYCVPICYYPWGISIYTYIYTHKSFAKFTVCHCPTRKANHLHCSYRGV